MQQKDITKLQTQAALILLISSFIFSQEMIWEVIGKIWLVLSNNDISRTGNIISTSAAVFFCLFSVILSDYLRIAESLFSRHPFMVKIVTKLSDCILKFCILIFYRLWDVILRTDSSAQINSEQNDMLKQPGIMRISSSITIVAVFWGVFLHLIDSSHPCFVNVMTLLSKFVSNLIPLLFLQAEVRERIKKRNTPS